MENEILDNTHEENTYSLAKFTRVILYFSLAIIAFLTGLQYLIIYLPVFLPEIKGVESWFFLAGYILIIVIIVASIRLTTKLFQLDIYSKFNSLSLAAIVGLVLLICQLIFNIILHFIILNSELAEINFGKVILRGIMLGVFCGLISLNSVQKLRRENRIISGILILLFCLVVGYYAQVFQ